VRRGADRRDLPPRTLLAFIDEQPRLAPVAEKIDRKRFLVE